MGQEPRKLIVGVVMAVVYMAISGLLLYLAQREIAIGTAYAVWTGIGVSLHGDPGSLGRYFGVALIIAGVVTLRLAH